MSKPIVALDPGHGGFDFGELTDDETRESNIVLAVARSAKRWLDYAGCQVVMTRDKDVHVTQVDRVHIAKDNKADLLVSIHAEAGGATGFEAFYLSTSHSGRKLAMHLIDAYASHFHHLHRLGWPNRGVMPAGFCLLRHANPMPAARFVLGFIDHERDVQILKDNQRQDNMGYAIAKGVEAYLTDEWLLDKKHRLGHAPADPVTFESLEKRIDRLERYLCIDDSILPIR